MQTSNQLIRKLKFNNKNKPGFYADVKKEVNFYFQDKGISKNANAAMIIKTIFFLSAFVILYILIISETFGLWTSLGLAVIFGMTQTFIGFNISHDAIHGAYTSNRKINKLLGYTFNMLGLNSYVWEITHNKVHHTYTNIPGHDEDLEVAPGLICLSPNGKLKPFMKFQHFYAFLLYGFTTLFWVFRKDYKKIFQDKVGETDTSKHPMKEYIILFSTKLMYYIMFIVLPFIYMEITWWQFLIGFVSMHFAEGIVAGLVFQLAHVVEDIKYSEPDENWQMEESWAMTQMEGTANFAMKSSLATFLCGGLNYQIEHHLFPLVCHIHYPAISAIVKTTARKHNVPYNANPTFHGALKSHFNMLKKFGVPQLVP